MGFGSRLCGRIVGVPVGANCAPLVADLFLFCYEIDCQTIIRLTLLKLLAWPPDVWVACLVLIILVLNRWWVRFAPLSFS